MTTKQIEDRVTELGRLAAECDLEAAKCAECSCSACQETHMILVVRSRQYRGMQEDMLGQLQDTSRGSAIATYIGAAAIIAYLIFEGVSYFVR